VKTYTFEDVVAGLNAVQPYDWAKFLNSRLQSTAAHAPLGGVEGSGWKLVYSDKQSTLLQDAEKEGKYADFTYSLGFRVKEDGTLSDVKLGSPAAKAGMAPAVKLMAVNNRQYNPDVLREALKSPVDLLVRDGEIYKTFHVEYRGGAQYPHLVRDETKPDLLTAIVSPLAKP
jgi:predicted metalloprotease with PDZ domain